MNYIKFKKVSDFDRGILFELLVDAYSYDSRYKKCCGSDWQEFDDFCFDNIEIADRCGFKFHQRRSNKSEISFSGEYIDYEYIL